MKRLLVNWDALIVPADDVVLSRGFACYRTLLHKESTFDDAQKRRASLYMRSSEHDYSAAVQLYEMGQCDEDGFLGLVFPEEQLTDDKRQAFRSAWTSGINIAATAKRIHDLAGVCGRGVTVALFGHIDPTTLRYLCEQLGSQSISLQEDDQHAHYFECAAQRMRLFYSCNKAMAMRHFFDYVEGDQSVTQIVLCGHVSRRDHLQLAAGDSYQKKQNTEYYRSLRHSQVSVAEIATEANWSACLQPLQQQPPSAAALVAALGVTNTPPPEPAAAEHKPPSGCCQKFSCSIL